MVKFIIERETLSKSLAHVQNVVERRQTIPILANVLIEANQENGGGISLRATDNEIEIFDKVSAHVEKIGGFTVSAHKLYDVVKKLPNGAQIECTLQEESSQLLIRVGRSRFSLPTIPPEGFPAMASEISTFTFRLTTLELQSLIDRTQFAVSTEEARYNLNGIFLHEKGGETRFLTAVATDGHRLATAKVKMPDGASGMPGVIIPRKTIGELVKLIAESSQDVVVSVSENQIRFSFGDMILSSRLIDGTYPDYERVIPSDNDKFMEVDSVALTAVVDRVAVISERSRGIKLVMKKSTLNVTASSLDEGSAEDEIEAGYDAEQIEIGFNYRYLLDILAQIKGGTVRFSLLNGTSPVVIQDANDASVLYVLMPMRV